MTANLRPNTVVVGNGPLTGGVVSDLIDCLSAQKFAPRVQLEAAFDAGLIQSDASTAIRNLVERGILAQSQTTAATIAFKDYQLKAFDEIAARAITGGLMTAPEAADARHAFSADILSSPPLVWLVTNGLLTEYQTALMSPESQRRTADESPDVSDLANSISFSSSVRTSAASTLAIVRTRPVALIAFMTTLTLSRVAFTLGAGGSLDDAWSRLDTMQLLVFGDFTRIICPSMLVVGAVVAARPARPPSAWSAFFLAVGTALVFGEPVSFVEGGGTRAFFVWALAGLLVVRRATGQEINGGFVTTAALLALLVVFFSRSEVSMSLPLDVFAVLHSDARFTVHEQSLLISLYWHLQSVPVVAFALAASLRGTLFVDSTAGWLVEWATTKWSIYPAAWILGSLAATFYQITQVMAPGSLDYLPTPTTVVIGVTIFMIAGFMASAIKDVVGRMVSR